MLFRGGGSKFPCSSSTMMDYERAFDEDLDRSMKSADQRIKKREPYDPISELIKVFGDDSP
jgi:hypothetical protein